MKKIVSLKNCRERHQNKTENTQISGYCEHNKNFNTFLRYMASESTKILESPKRELFEKREKEERKEFDERYSNMLATAPQTNEGKLKYFAYIMLNLLPSVFHGEQKNQFFTDYSILYLSEFDTAYCEYRNDNKKYEKEYPFRFPLLAGDSLENAIQSCLRQIINSKDKTEIMWQASRHFELYHNMLNYFSY